MRERNTCKRIETSAVSVVSGKCKCTIYRSYLPFGGTMVSREKVLERFFALVAEIEKFLQEKNPTLSTRNGASAVKLLSDHDWLLDLAFLVDITQHLNNLCMKLQGREQLLPELFNAVKAFQSKLNLFQLQLSTGNSLNPCPHLWLKQSLILFQTL